ncbi:hypothetical protein WA158_000492 [Blastocystis sp. Blastoise]
MASVEIDPISVVKLNQIRIQHLPCEIDSNETTDMCDYFQISENENKIKETTLRGRLLVGKDIPLPNSTQGFILSQDSSESTTKNCVTGSFQNITYWNTDSVCSDNNFLTKNFDWFTISKALNEDSDEESKSN